MTIELDRRLRIVERQLEQLLARDSGIVISNANVSATPTDAELDSAFGDATILYNGFIGLIDDAGAGTTVWLCAIVNNKWWYEQLTLAT